MTTFSRALIAAVIACACNALLRTAVRAFADVPDAFEPFTWPPILVATCVGVGAGTIVYAGMRPLFGAKTDTAFRWVGYGALVLSLITPVTLLWSNLPQYPDTSVLTVAALELMHGSTGLATILALTSARRSAGVAGFLLVPADDGISS